MKLTKYGITLHLMKEEDIECVRQWRNSPSVVNTYEYREYITPEMQKAWFESVHNINNLYLIIEYEGERIGVVNAKNVDYEKMTCESGIFIPDGKYSSTFVPAMVMILTMETGFRLFSFATGYAHVLKTNKPVQSMIKAFGYELCPNQENVENQLYTINRDRFLKKAKKLLAALNIMEGSEEPILVTIPKSELTDPVIREWDQKCRENPGFSKWEETPEEKIYFLI